MQRCHLPEWFGGACASITDKFPRYRMVHIVRDPVEVVISGYLYHKHGPAPSTPLSTPTVISLTPSSFLNLPYPHIAHPEGVKSICKLMLRMLRNAPPAQPSRQIG